MAVADQVKNAAAQELIAEAGVGPFFWGTIWIPYVSYLWTLAWIFEKIFKSVTGNAAVKISLFDKWEKITMILIDLLWFFLTAFFIGLILQMVCHGDGTTLGSIGAFFGKAAVKIGSLGQADFSFCDQIPKF
jgi:hypothetical protein